MKYSTAPAVLRSRFLAKQCDRHEKTFFIAFLVLTVIAIVSYFVR